MRRPLGLRRRATLAFALVGLFAVVVVASATFLLARGYFLDQRRDSAQQQAFANARVARSALRVADVDSSVDVVGTLRSAASSDVVVRHGDRWYAGSVAVGQDDVPDELQQVVADGSAGRQLYRSSQGDLRLAVGVPMAAVDGVYFEIFRLDDLERTLGTLRNVSVAVAVGTVALTALLGRVAAGRVVSPLGPVAAAAERIAGGDLRTRLSEEGDADLEPLVDSFNSMAQSLEDRIEREQRFTSDVSHELRSPLAALRAGVELLERRRPTLPEEALPTVDMLAARVEAFEELVLDLLEIARLDAKEVELDREHLDVHVLVENVLALHPGSRAEITVVGEAPVTIWGDRRRLAQAIANVAGNAARYAGGLTRVTIERREGSVAIILDDEGPGVRPEERRAILQRFARGAEGRRRGAASGTGLGLALTVGHVHAHGGTVTVEDAPGGGARFEVILPVGGPR